MCRWEVSSGIGLGTTYRVTYRAHEPGTYDLDIALLLQQFSRALSIFDPHSEVSRFNRTGTLSITSSYVYPVLQASAIFYALTEGAFDPTVGALVEASGFGRAGAGGRTQTQGWSSGVGFGHIQFDEKHVERTHPDVQLNFNAIAKGYAVDVVGQFLAKRGVNHYLIELGGEVRCRGLNAQGQPWRIGIESPTLDGELNTHIQLTNKALATSGTYRNRYEHEGVDQHHLLDPRTGQMAVSDLLSVTVVADECMTADALATAFMVMGAEPMRQFLAQHPQWQAHVIPAPALAYEV